MPAAENLTFSLLLFVCFVFLTRWSTGRGFRFSPVLLFYVLFVLQQAIGCMALAPADEPGGRLARLGLQLGIIGFTLGVASVTVIARFQPSLELTTVRQRMNFRESGFGIKLSVLVLGYGVATLLMAVYFHQSGGIPLFDGVSAMMSGNETVAAQQVLKQRRMELTYFETSSYRGQGYIDQIRMVVLPFIFGCFILWALGSRNRKHQLLATASGVPVLLFLLGTGQRHPALAFMMAAGIAGYVVSRPETHRKLLGVFFGCGLALFFSLTYLLGRYTHTDSLISDLSMVFVGLWNRIVYSNAIGTLALFDLFPNPEPFRWGATWVNDLRGFLPGPYVAFSAWLFRRLYGVVGTASPMCFAEMYANFGLAGVFTGAAILGGLLQAMQVRWARHRVYRAEHVVLYALLSMAFARWAMGGLLGPMQYGLLSLPPLLVCIHVARLILQSLLDAIVRGSRLPRSGANPSVQPGA